MPRTMEQAIEAANLCLQAAEETGSRALAKETELGQLSAMFIARAGQSVCSAGVLAQRGLVGDAMSVMRTVVEMDIDYAYITTEPATLIRRFAEYDHVAKFRLAKAIDRLHDGAVSREAMRVLEQRHDTARLNNPESEFNWAGKSLKKRAEIADAKVGRESIAGGRMRNYELLYADGCNASHSCYGTLEYALVGSDAEPTIRFGTMEPDSKPVMLAFGVMLLLTETVADECGLDGLEPLFAKPRACLAAAE